MTNVINVGVKLVKERSRDYLVGHDVEVFDMATGNVLPTRNVRIIAGAGDLVIAEVTLVISDLTIEEE